MPPHGHVCHAPSNADLANTFLTVGLDYRDLECTPSGGEFQAQVEYTGRDGQTRGIKTEPQNIPNNWMELIDFNFDVSYESIKPGSEVKVFITPQREIQAWQSFTYETFASKPSNRRAVIITSNSTSAESRSVETIRRQAYPNCD
ncbi:hypothetical protein PG988_000987 [Apiospora saccharicola]